MILKISKIGTISLHKTSSGVFVEKSA